MPADDPPPSGFAEAMDESRINARRYSVFLSHASADKWIAVRMSEQLEERGTAFFRDDRDIAGGDDIPDEIRKAIGESDEVVVLLTPMSLTRDWVKLELGAAWALRKRIVIVLHHLDADPLPDTFARRKAIQLNDLDEYLEELEARVSEAHS